MRRIGSIVGMMAGLASVAPGQTSVAPRAQLRGLFVGVETEASRVTTSTTRESGSGGGIALGYAFNSRWTLYGQLGQANIGAVVGGTYSLTEMELGGRVHFLSERGRVAPFLKFGVAGMAASQYSGGSNFTASGGGLLFGGGVDAYVVEHLALSAGITRTLGLLGDFAHDGIAADAAVVGVQTTRFQLGLVWFP
jgi:hypothetical protein